LNGREINPRFSYTLNYYNGTQERFNHAYQDYNISNYELSSYFRKICNASFNKDELSIVVTGYESNDDTRFIKDTTKNQVLYFDFRSKFNTLYYSPFKDMTDQETWIKSVEKFSRLVVSPEGDIVAINKIKTNIIVLLAADGLELIKLDGRNILFTNDGKHVIWARGNEIHKLPVSPDEINDQSINKDKGFFKVI
jgi:hypothetical protein